MLWWRRRRWYGVEGSWFENQYSIFLVPGEVVGWLTGWCVYLLVFVAIFQAKITM